VITAAALALVPPGGLGAGNGSRLAARARSGRELDRDQREQDDGKRDEHAARRAEDGDRDEHRER
jgi:hypothetical protein